MNYLDKLKYLIQRHDTGSTIQVGARIIWTRGDLTVQHGIVDFVHLGTDGQVWAFCTVPSGDWTAVNVRFAKGAQA